MIIYHLLGVAAVAVTCQDIFKQKYKSRSHGGTFFFSGMISLFAMLCFLMVNRDWSWNTALLIPAAGFALAYATCTVFTVLAIRHGSLAMTSLIVSCSLLIPSFYGVLWLKEAVSATLVIGLVLLIMALFLINYEKKNQKVSPITWKWSIFVFLAFVGNGLCATVQKAEQIRFGDEGRNLFMLLALAMVSVSLFVVSFLVKQERIMWKETVRNGWCWAFLCGIANALTNYLTLYLNSFLPASFIYPVISAGGIVLSFLYSTLVIREQFHWRQRFGFFIGVLSVILLNL